MVQYVRCRPVFHATVGQVSLGPSVEEPVYRLLRTRNAFPVDAGWGALVRFLSAYRQSTISGEGVVQTRIFVCSPVECNGCML